MVWATAVRIVQPEAPIMKDVEAPPAHGDHLDLREDYYVAPMAVLIIFLVFLICLILHMLAMRHCEDEGRGDVYYIRARATRLNLVRMT